MPVYHNEIGSMQRLHKIKVKAKNFFIESLEENLKISGSKLQPYVSILWVFKTGSFTTCRNDPVAERHYDLLFEKWEKRRYKPYTSTIRIVKSAQRACCALNFYRLNRNLI